MGKVLTPDEYNKRLEEDDNYIKGEIVQDMQPVIVAGMKGHLTEDIIDEGVPIPKLHPNHRYPFEKMNVGDSFFTTYLLVRTMAHYAGKKLDMKFTTRKYPPMNGRPRGVRVWRVS